MGGIFQHFSCFQARVSIVDPPVSWCSEQPTTLASLFIVVNSPITDEFSLSRRVSLAWCALQRHQAMKPLAR